MQDLNVKFDQIFDDIEKEEERVLQKKKKIDENLKEIENEVIFYNTSVKEQEKEIEEKMENFDKNPSKELVEELALYAKK